MLLRLGDLYAEEGRAARFDAVQALYADQEACLATPGCDPAGLRADEAAFGRAVVLQDLGAPDEAAAQFLALVLRWPASDRAPDAYLHLGDRFSARREIQAALLAYSHASRDETACAYGPALYRLAWSYHELGEDGVGRSALQKLVAYTQGPAHPSDRRRRQRLRSDALAALVRFYAASLDTDEPYEHFTALGRPPLARHLLEELGALHADRGSLPPAIALYRRLLADAPLDPAAPRYHYAITRIYQRAGRASEAQVEVERMRSAYGPGSGWALANAADAAALQQAAWMTADLLSREGGE